MSKIVGYVGRRAAAPMLLEALRRLDYRDSDSSGIAVQNGGDVKVVRAVGRLGRLEEALSMSPLRGTTGIGHTRSTSQALPTIEISHLHSVSDISLVHEGAIQNRALLRSELTRQGVRLSSSMDGELLAHLVERARRSGARDLIAAVRMALRRVEGPFAIAVMTRDVPNTIVVAKRGLPLTVGVGDGEMFCASQAAAISADIHDILLLEDGDIAELHPTGVRLISLAGHEIDRPLRRMEASLGDEANKGDFAHYMLKEIHEQPEALERTLRDRIDLETGTVIAEALGIPKGLGATVDRVYFIACGTSHHATIAGKYWLEKLARLPAICELASEAREREPALGPGDLVVAVSQSGETADTLAALHTVKKQGARVLAITNVQDSAIPRASDFASSTHAGPEIGIASTKCFTSQLAVLLMLAIHLGIERDALPRGRARELLGSLVGMPDSIRRTLRRASQAAEAASLLAPSRDVIFLGRGFGYPIALEGALKLKETSYLHAEGYAAGEFRHGPIALLEEGLPVVAIAPRDSNYPRMLSNSAEARSRGGRLITVMTEGDDEASGSAAVALEIPAAIEDVLPFLTVIPLQLLAYHTALLRGSNVDQPRNLVKAVTSE